MPLRHVQVFLLMSESTVTVRKVQVHKSVQFALCCSVPHKPGNAHHVQVCTLIAHSCAQAVHKLGHDGHFLACEPLGHLDTMIMHKLETRTCTLALFLAVC